MLPSSFCSSDNVRRARQYRIAAIVLTGAVSACIAFSTIAEARGLLRSMASLRVLRAEKARMSGQVKTSELRASSFRSIGNGGVDAFAVQFTGWARTRGVRIDSLNPAGANTALDTAKTDKSLGRWTSEKVKIEGAGSFEKVLGLMEALGSPSMPVQLQSYSMVAIDNGKSGDVAFTLEVNVFKENGSVSQDSVH